MEAPGELLLLSMAAFATAHPGERASIQAALGSLPRAPSSTMYYRFGSHGLQVLGENREPSASGGGGQAQATQQQQGTSSGVADNRREHAFDFGVGSSSSSSGRRHAMGAAPSVATGISGSKRVAREEGGHSCGFEFEGSDQGRHAARGQACGLGGLDQGPSGGSAHDEDARGYGFGDARCVGQRKDAAPTHQLRIGAGRDQGRSVRLRRDAREDGRGRRLEEGNRAGDGYVAASVQAHGDACVEDQGAGSSSVQQLPSSVDGSDGMIAFEVGKELTLHGSVVSSPWNELWLGKPLIFHDLDLVRAMKDQGGMPNERIDLSGKITSILLSHPGPVSYFRIDSSVINNGAQQKIEEWCDVLRKKNVETVVMANCQWPSHPIEFPLQSLNCSSLRTLHLCFFNIPDMYLDHVSSLAVIDLACCRISDENLFALVCQCVSLRELDIGMFSEGKERIRSESLKFLQIWRSSVSHITIQWAPKLEKVIIGAAQGMKSFSSRTSSSTWISILGAPMLREVWFNLSSQTRSIDNVYLDVGHVPITSLRKLELSIAFKERKGRHALLNFFRSCTELKELVLWREDKVYFEEECDVHSDDWSSALKDIACLKSHLQVLKLFDYGGGETEIAIASAVLEHGASIENLTIMSTTSNADDILSQAKQKLEKVESYKTIPNEASKQDSMKTN
ncbi:Os11g0144600 [Oryza sativa Japonica Group]|uniref:Os11g0144600 protein n=1 Tax=Oryza sativa subsp. japonica TaxID=39947 RepID=A0A0P0XYZ4_ORYSJ|nr:Os11g0144600 [Oryza sativa Japonica Group]